MNDGIDVRDELELQKAFEKILSIESFSDHVNEIVELIYKNKLDRNAFNELLGRHEINNIRDIKEELLDLLIIYINIVLIDNVISKNESNNIIELKKLFEIKEGDFYKNRKDEIAEVLHRQLSRIYTDDDKIDETEALHKVELQKLFDLSYDQFLEFANVEDKQALDRGADLKDLDTVFKLPDNLKAYANVAGRTISQKVKDLVWNRDGGKCVNCQSKEKLEFDHIIPYSLGGSNTYRNIQLLCETCNRGKSNKI